MARETVYLMMMVLALLLGGLYIFIFVTARVKAYQAKVRQKDLQIIKPALDLLLAATEVSDTDVDLKFNAYFGQAQTQRKSNACRAILEELLLEHLEHTQQAEHRQRALTVAFALGLPQRCLIQINSRKARNVALGCRKAGLYQYREAIPHMQKALLTVSGETQFQILMGISRMGEVTELCRAFEMISQQIIINERAVFELLSAFSGDKLELYSRMFRCQTEYIVILFLKSADKAVVESLSKEISAMLGNGSKEMRIAAIRAMAKMGQNAPVESLIQTLEDADWEVRALSAKTLGRLTGTAAAMALSSALRDDEWWVRQNAAAALLSAPDHDQLFLSAAETGDIYALDSIIYVLERAGKGELIAKILAAVPAPENKAETGNSTATDESADGYRPLTA